VQDPLEKLTFPHPVTWDAIRDDISVELVLVGKLCAATPTGKAQA
jgi:hypothetical protein